MKNSQKVYLATYDNMSFLDMITRKAKEIAEKAAREALTSCDQDWDSAYRLLVWRAQRDPQLCQAIRVYCEYLSTLTESDVAGHC